MPNSMPEKELEKELEVSNKVDTDPLWTVKDVARYLQLNPETVRAMARREELPAFKVGRVWRFRRFEVKNNLNPSSNQ